MRQLLDRASATASILRIFDSSAEREPSARALSFLRRLQALFLSRAENPIRPISAKPSASCRPSNGSPR